MDKGDAMAELERQTRAPEGFVAATTGPEGGTRNTREEAQPIQNPDALDVDLDED